MTDWFEEWFGEEYLTLYPHRDDGEARRAAALIASRVDIAQGALALDLGCGGGRHQRAMEERWRVVGLDLSPALLRVARSTNREAPLVRADMRALPFADDAFDLVVNLFTSFGYFRDDTQSRRVVDDVARVTRRGGWFVLDYLNAGQVRRTLVPHDARRLGSHMVEQERAISDDGRYVRKTITLSDEGRTFVERVRLFERDELRGMLEGCGFDVRHVAGDYDGAPASDRAPRTILFGKRR